MMLFSGFFSGFSGVDRFSARDFSLMTLQQLRYALAVAAHHSFNEAARAVFVTQPTLSTALRELEEELGIQIFERSSRGIEITPDGMEFLGYARKVIEQADELRERFAPGKPRMIRYTVSSQHYSFVVSAFIRLVNAFGVESYDFCLRETRTMSIITDVRSLTADIGILYLSDHNRKVLERCFRENDLEFTGLMEVSPHIFVSSGSPLTSRKKVSFGDLAGMPLISFEQGSYSSDYFDEELIRDQSGNKVIRVSDRATLFNLLRGLNGYTVSSGVISRELNPDVAAIPLESDARMTIGYILRKGIKISGLTETFIANLKQCLREPDAGCVRGR